MFYTVTIRNHVVFQADSPEEAKAKAIAAGFEVVRVAPQLEPATDSVPEPS